MKNKIYIYILNYPCYPVYIFRSILYIIKSPALSSLKKKAIKKNMEKQNDGVQKKKETKRRCGKISKTRHRYRRWRLQPRLLTNVNQCFAQHHCRWFVCHHQRTNPLLPHVTINRAPQHCLDRDSIGCLSRWQREKWLELVYGQWCLDWQISTLEALL